MASSMCFKAQVSARLSKGRVLAVPRTVPTSSSASYALKSARGARVIREFAPEKKAETEGQAVNSDPVLPSFPSQEPLIVEVMTKDPVTFKQNMSIKEAVRVMLENNISGGPVVDESGKLVGMLSESDLMWKGAGAPEDCFIIPPTYIGFLDALIYWRDNKQFETEVHKILAKTVAEAMTTEAITISSSARMSEAAGIMLKRKVNRIPVVENNQVVGVVTRHDILQGMAAANWPFL